MGTERLVEGLERFGPVFEASSQARCSAQARTRRQSALHSAVTEYMRALTIGMRVLRRSAKAQALADAEPLGFGEHRGAEGDV